MVDVVRAVSILDPSSSSVDFSALLTPILFPRTVLGAGLFASGFLLQATSHIHLASLPKYTPPQKPLTVFYRPFTYIVAPHYTAELMMYIGLAIATAPEGRWVSATLATVPAFVLGNLGSVSWATKEWERTKFGEESVRGRWRMVPGLW